jgi:UDP-N-acetylmuramate dehydrogenase
VPGGPRACYPQSLPISVASQVPLAPLTTLELGGPARFFVGADDEASVVEALAWARARGLPVLALGGGSNLVVADAGFDGLVVRVAPRGLTFTDGDPTLVEVAAGEPWDEVVAACVARGLAGLECLSGIPGLAGATPIQNVGAYGQEVAETVHAVRVLDRASGEVRPLPAAACAFSYRDSAFKQAPDRQVVLAVTFALRPGGPPTLRYPELRAAVGPSPSLAEVRAAVLALRRRKSMVIDTADPNRRSVGSFFTNPVVSAADAERVIARALAEGLVTRAEEVPRFPVAGGAVKLAAGWLIERSGVARGLRRGAVGISSRHALALVHHGGGTTADLLALACEVRDTVAARFGVRLVPEPTLVGVTPGEIGEGTTTLGRG